MGRIELLGRKLACFWLGHRIIHVNSYLHVCERCGKGFDVPIHKYDK